MKVYVASKVWHAPDWRELRSVVAPLGVEITSRWIDLEPSDDIVQNRKDELWQECLEDVVRADCVIIYCGAVSEEQRGVCLEAGIAMGVNKPIYCINSCKTFAASKISDVAFTHHKLWNWVENHGAPLDMTEGFARATWAYKNDEDIQTELLYRERARGAI